MTTNQANAKPIAFRPARSLKTAQVRRKVCRLAYDPGNDNAPSGIGFIALLEAFRPTGGTAPGEIVDQLLNEHQVGFAVSLAGLIHTGQVFGFEWRTNLWIPMFQFDADNLTLKEGPQRVRSELPPLWSGWMQASWFATPNARLDGRSPVDILDSDIDAVLWATQSLVRVEEFPLSGVRGTHEIAMQM